MCQGISILYTCVSYDSFLKASLESFSQDGSDEVELGQNAFILSRRELGALPRTVENFLINISKLCNASIVSWIKNKRRPNSPNKVFLSG